MRAIKALVITMGVLLVGGLALLGYGLSQKAAKLGRPAEEQAAVVVAPPPPAAFGTVAVPVAPGARLVTWQAADGRLTLLVEEDGRQRLILLDPTRGAVAGSFVLTPQ